MKNFKLDEEVEVRFIGKIKEIGFASNGDVVFKVDAGSDRPTVLFARERDINKLLTPEDLK